MACSSSPASRATPSSRPARSAGGTKSPGVTEDREIRLGNLPETFRLVTYRDAEMDIVYQFVTNALDLPAQTVADLYKMRWQIELFFKWIKQNLKVKSFLGTSMNAVKTQIWIALCLPGAVDSEIPVKNWRLITTYVTDIVTELVRATGFERTA